MAKKYTVHLPGGDTETVEADTVEETESGLLFMTDGDGGWEITRSFAVEEYDRWEEARRRRTPKATD